ncbi:MAG: RES family NAD+ phosphorylase [Bacteroidaceae bacterium]|nr:RES family NAD+ phosphorylase [Bacteroidaceae bacterium]
MDELKDEIVCIANDAFSYLECQIERLRSVTSCNEAKSIMQDVSGYLFPQINCNTLFTHLVRCVKINKTNGDSDCITHAQRFSYPPSVHEPGRMNTLDAPTFYAANDIKTSLLETDITEGDEFYAGIWAVKDNASMLSYPCVPYKILCELSANGDEKALEMKNCIDRFPCIRRMTDLI